MNFERIIGDVAAMNLNLYDLALYSDGMRSSCRKTSILPGSW